MGGSTAARKSSGRRGRRGRSVPMSEINVTPMVDVMLVLLIVFMVAAPLLTVGVPIDLPQTQAKSIDAQSTPITVSVTPQGEVYLNETIVPLEELVAGISALAGDDTEERIYLRGDASAGYGEVMRIMGVLSGAGYSRINLITEQEQ